jgi:hypothetical protein
MSNDLDDQAKSSGSGLIGRALKSESFVEKAVLLLLTAILSGFLIPAILKSADVAREKREAVARAQSTLLEDLSETILAYETLALDVSWYGTMAARDTAMQRKAYERYSERVVDLVARWRAQSARAQTLASRDVAAKTDSFLVEAFTKQDTPINAMWSTCHTSCAWQSQHDQSVAMLAAANRLISELSVDLGLTRSRD